MDGMDGRPAPVPDLGPPSWSRRYKENIDRLRSGDWAQIVEVVRQLSDRKRCVGISPGEWRMLVRARQMLDDPGGGLAGVREPRRPFPPSDAISGTVSEPQPIKD